MDSVPKLVRRGAAAVTAPVAALSLTACGDEPSEDALESAQELIDETVDDAGSRLNDLVTAQPEPAEGEAGWERVESGGVDFCDSWELEASEVNAPAGQKYSSGSKQASPVPAGKLGEAKSTFLQIAAEHGFSDTQDQLSDELQGSLDARDSNGNSIHFAAMDLGDGNVLINVFGESTCFSDT